jgi:hypothetical protein
LSHRSSGQRRAYQALVNVLPPAVEVRSEGDLVMVSGVPLHLHWIGRGWLSDIRRGFDDDDDRPLIVAARRMSPGARNALREASIGWVDESGAAEIMVGPIVVSKSGRPTVREQRISSWTPSVLAVAEALLCGRKATVASTRAATGLSSGSCTNALRFLMGQELLVSDTSRGRNSARRIADFDHFLESYAVAVAEADPAPVLPVGVVWRDLSSGLAKTGREWSARRREWACTGALAASVLAPYLTSVGTADVYLDVDTIAGLESAAADVGLQPIEGGRLNLRPFPTVTSQRLSSETQGLRVVPWPRIYADLRPVGVRGEEAAEHLREVMRAG